MVKKCKNSQKAEFWSITLKFITLLFVIPFIFLEAYFFLNVSSSRKKVKVNFVISVISSETCEDLGIYFRPKKQLNINVFKLLTSELLKQSQN